MSGVSPLDGRLEIGKYSKNLLIHAADRSVLPFFLAFVACHARSAHLFRPEHICPTAAPIIRQRRKTLT